MKFSLFYELQIAEHGEAEPQFFRDCITQVELADKLGYHCVWAVEHHGLYEYSHSSAPEVFLSFVAARTKDIRLGHGITLTPARFNHPIRIAERVATLDILSEGRVNWGSGKSSSNVEARLFEIDPAVLAGQWEEALNMIPQMWKLDEFSWDGEHYKIPPTHIVPKPVQQPHPPIFAPSSSPKGLEQIGKLGVGALNFSFANFEDLKAKVASYKEAVKDAAPVNWQKLDHFAVTVNTCVLPVDQRACEYGFRGAKYFRDAFNMYYFRDDRPPLGHLQIDRAPIPPRVLDATRLMRQGRDTQLLSIIGDPVLAREKIALFEEAGVDEVILIMQLGTVPHEIVMESLQCFAESVLWQLA